jgi:3-oxoacyl-[acyl-carrier protein] reductase
LPDTVAVHPGYIDVGLDYDTDQGHEAGIPMKRFGRAEEVANLIAFLASEKAAYATGSVFNLDGGVLLPNCVENNLSEY